MMMVSQSSILIAGYYDSLANSPLTTDEQKVVKTDDIGQNSNDSVIRQGAYNPGKNVKLYNQ
jgi:hypothetical protein